eukprot:CAMPEP_0202968582 /NCGR_PEP_ID=MMETSP1396-20130829/13929_1 /ASSEMBLY_ACC=CAM_ASM_000872 /TAXON_ID= /ORGANISM="Pseudokeronopsis sp., Strain Brazil" /LENGTH=151 /DNA_ID=CAMNT_0049695041 /DNA_START=1819 /DNA_END=2275 /DNA_ORIENTATION=-
MEKSTFEHHGGGQRSKANSIDEIYVELIQLRDNNRVLEKRVKTLEKQNIEISKNLHFVGNNEPSRPIFKSKRNVKAQNAGYSQDDEEEVNPPSRGYDEEDNELSRHEKRIPGMNKVIPWASSTPKLCKMISSSRVHQGKIGTLKALKTTSG